MHRERLNRRQVMKTGAAAAALPFVAALSATAAPASTKKAGMTLGMTTDGFPEYTNQQVAEILAGAGVQVVQIFLTASDSKYWVYEQRPDLSSLTPSRAKAIADTYRSAGLSIHSLAVYSNLIHPDESEIKANLAYFDAMMAAARAMGIDTVVTESGDYRSSDTTPCLYHFQKAVWKRMVGIGKQLAAMAERHGTVVLLEPSYQTFFASAKRTRMFLEEVGSPRIRVLLDPANLFEVSQVEEGFVELKPWISGLHAKDWKRHGEDGLAAGLGDINYPEFVALAAKYAPVCP